MKTKILCLLFVIFFTNLTTSAQLVAGGTASGQVISNPNVNLSVAIINQTKYGLIDLDCDSVADMRIELFKGPTIIDGANFATLFVLNPLYEICVDTSDVFGVIPVKYFNLDDTINYIGSYDWLNDTIYNLGNSGCMDCPGPFSVNNKFISYRNTLTSQLGWIKILFDLNDGGGTTIPITLTIPQILSPCTTTELPDPNIASCGIFTFDTIIYPTSCDSFCYGMIHIANLTGGTPPYSFSWSNGETDSIALGLCSGNYNLIITDGSGNTCSIDLYVPAPLPITFSLVVINVSCYGFSDGSICVNNLSGGSSPYAFQWNDPLSQITDCITNASAGSYTVCVTDANGCTVCQSATVLEPAEIQVTENVTNESCLGCCDGAIELFPSGGVGSYSYIFSPLGSVINPVNNLCSGTYSWCVTDAIGCSTCDTVVVSFSTSIKNNADATIFSVYPNPFKDKIYLNTAKQFVEVYTVLGEKIFTRSSMDGIQDYTNEIDLTTTKSGMYFIVIKDSDGRSVYKEKIVKE